MDLEKKMKDLEVEGEDHEDDSGSEGLDEEDDDQNWDDWVEEDDSPTRCLACSQVLPDSEQMLEHCVKSHKFDLKKLIKEKKYDFYQSIKLVNFIRSQTVSKPLGESEPLQLPAIPVFSDNEEYLQPVIPDDPLLMALGNLDEEEEEQQVQSAQVASSTEQELRAQVQALQRKLQETEQSFRNYVALTEATFSVSGSELEDLRNEKVVVKQEPVVEDLDYYFKSYSHYSIHESMLKDFVRTESYRDFILQNPEIFKDKVVLDVGCGTSILSLFAAKAGAKKVIGVDASHVAEKAREIVKLNGFEDVITIVKGKIEEVVLPVEKVDIIISEWMGYFLLYESMLDSVLYARDKYLAPGGRVFPVQSRMFLASADDSEFISSKYYFWGDVYGFNLSPMKQNVFIEPFVDLIDARLIGSNPCLIKDIDAEKVLVKELDFKSDFSLEVIRDHTCNCIVGYFDIPFDTKAKTFVSFSTGPASINTHWKQTLFYLEKTVQLVKGDILEGSISVQKNATNPRCLDIVISYGKKGEAAFVQNFEL